MTISPKISPRIINNIASLYNDVNRVFMEYIDNSIDSADQHWLNEELNSYKKPIKVCIELVSSVNKNHSVIISDNCYGITNFTKVVDSIGDSDKKNNRFTNGEFGFGIYSFMAACSNLEISSKEPGKEALKLKLNREQFDKKHVEDVHIPEPRVIKRFPHSSGTLMQLSAFDRGIWKSINGDDLQKEVEKHFELILSRKNLEIKIIDAQGAELVCKPFDYSEYEGEVYEDHITHFDIEKGGRYKVKQTIRPAKPISIFLKITKGVVPNKPPVFISKGRRICEIKDVKSFRSKHKSDIWGHANVTGYIDLQDMLGPTIARTDFKNNDKSRALFKELMELEDLILDYVKRANAQTDEKHYHQLEDALNKALSRLARLDAMNYRTAYLMGGKTDLESGSTGTKITEDGGMKDFGNGRSRKIGGGVGEGEGEGSGLEEGGEDLPGGQAEGDQAKNVEQMADSEFKGKERKKSGFNIRISDAEPQVDAETDKPLRSILSGSEIVIFKKHPDFQSRLSHKRQGGSKITDRLLAYVAGEITVHYKDAFYNKRQGGQPVYNKDMFVSVTEFIYQLETDLSPLSGKNLSELS